MAYKVDFSAASAFSRKHTTIHKNRKPMIFQAFPCHSKKERAVIIQYTQKKNKRYKISHWGRIFLKGTNVFHECNNTVHFIMYLYGTYMHPSEIKSLVVVATQMLG